MMELIKLFLISERDSYYGFIMMSLSFRAAFSSTGIAGILLNEFPPVFQSNPLLLCEFTLKEIIYVVCHEIDHILLNHPSEMVRLGQDDPDLMMKFNLAADAAVNDRINDEIKSRGYKFMRQPEGTITSDVLAEMFKLKSIAHAENYRYYFDLIKGRNNPEGQPQNQPQRMLEGIGGQSDTESTDSSGDGNEDQGQTIITVNNAGSLTDHDWQVNGDEEDADAAVRELVNAAVDTLMLLLRAFYTRFLNMMDKNSISIRNSIAKCIWKSDEFDNLIEDQLKIDSQVSTDEDKGEFMAILRTGNVQKEYHSRYAKVFSFFQDKIDEFIGRYPAYCAYLPARIMYNCILLPIEAETQDTALRIFSTLNDRRLPLSDSDIFKAQFYKYYSGKECQL